MIRKSVTKFPLYPVYWLCLICMQFDRQMFARYDFHLFFGSVEDTVIVRGHRFEDPVRKSRGTLGRPMAVWDGCIWLFVLEWGLFENGHFFLFASRDIPEGPPI